MIKEKRLTCAFKGEVMNKHAESSEKKTLVKSVIVLTLCLPLNLYFLLTDSLKTCSGTFYLAIGHIPPIIYIMKTLSCL